MGASEKWRDAQNCLLTPAAWLHSFLILQRSIQPDAQPDVRFETAT
jgi:hypothetical protein